METIKEFEADVTKWREERTDWFRNNEKSWLGLAGLFWLKEGNNSFGSDPKCNFVLPPTAPKKAGIFVFNKGEVTVKTELNVKITCNNGELPRRPLLDDKNDKPDYLQLANFIFVVLKRGSSTLIRVWDIDHPLRKAFSGLNFFPYNPECRIVAKYSGYAPFKTVRQEDIIGETHDANMIGYATFEWQGRQYRLDGEDGGGGSLFIAFKDKTNADTSYAGGRYLLSEKIENGQVVLDFNKAYNMACAYTLFATCDLSTPENRLPIAIEAGEKKYQDKK
jgi:uncharacterized protein (DUF1684 family)